MTAEQFIKDYTNHCSNELAYGGFHEWLTPEQALRTVEIAKDAFIKKACQWIKDNHEDIYIRYLRGCNSDDEILLFKKYMEGG